MDKFTHKINTNMLRGWFIVSFCLSVAYGLEVLKGFKDLKFYIVFLILAIVPWFIGFSIYKWKPEWKFVPHIAISGFFILYGYALLYAKSPMVFTFILPLLALLILYHDKLMIIISGIAAILMNAVFILVHYLNGDITIETSDEYEIQFFLLVLCVVAFCSVTVLYADVTVQNVAFVEMLDEKSKQINKMTLQTINAIASTIDAKDEYTNGHSGRVADYSCEIARELGLSEEECRNIHSVALLHDIGKIGIPDSILNKPGRLTEEEYHMMRQHAAIGGEILKDVNILPGLEAGARYHHERYDGRGYPEGLKGDRIPLIARIIAVADAYDAMTSNRVYRNRLTHDRVIEELHNGSGTQFDPVVLSAMFKLIDRKVIPEKEGTKETPNMEEVAGILSMVMEKREEQITEKMQLDALTNTFNRSYGETLMIEALDEGCGLLMLVDLDHFRVVNDTSGFVTGDIYLKTVAQCIRRMSDERIISRFGGDEFCVFFKKITNEEDAIHSVEHFMENVRLESVARKALEGLSVSVGMTLCRNRTDSLNDVLYRADKALYVAKQEGGGKYYLFHQDSINAYGTSYSHNDLNNLVKVIKDKSVYEGAFQISYPEFGRMYELIRKIAMRNKQSIQIIMFTILPNEGIDVSVEERDWAMEILAKAVIGSLRSIDVTTKYSSSQQIVMLLGLKEEQIQIVTDRVLKEFYRMYNRKKVNIVYEIADLGLIEE